MRCTAHVIFSCTLIVFRLLIANTIILIIIIIINVDKLCRFKPRHVSSAVQNTFENISNTKYKYTVVFCI